MLRPLSVLLSCCIAGVGLARAASPEAPAALPKPAEVLALLERVADWQIAHPPEPRPANRARDGWVQGTGYAGTMALAGISASPRFHDAMTKMAQENQWKPGKRIYDADDLCVTQTYSDLY